MNNYNWENVNKEIEKVVDNFGYFPSIRKLADFMDIPYSTMKDAINRGDVNSDWVNSQLSANIPDELPGNSNNGFSFTESGNEAKLLFKAAEPLTGEQAMELAGINPNEWEITSQKVNMWQVGAKSEQKDLTWVDGKKSGTVYSDGELSKTYLYQITVKLSKIKRKPVHATFNPIIIQSDFESRGLEKNDLANTEILYICDPHFGYRDTIYGELIPFHLRGFLSDLMLISNNHNPDITIWNGDLLDLADWSSFDTDPELLFTTQLAGIEAAWVLSQFRENTERQILLEGNHEQRLNRAIVKNMQSSFELKSVDELDGDSLLSVPKFLALDSIGTEWIGGYPDSRIKIGNAIFEHGNTVRKGSARTVAYMIKEAAVSRFFGHIHRTELASKWVSDIKSQIWVGSPGCACNKQYVPGANNTHNWQVGAFYITLNPDGDVMNVELINHSEGETFFRGNLLVANNYKSEFVDSLPDKWRNRF